MEPENPALKQDVSGGDDYSHSTQPSGIEKEMQRAWRFFGQQKFDKAADSFETVLQADSRHAPAMHFLGLCQIRLNQIESGLGLLQGSVRLAPSCAAFHNNLGLVFSELKQWNNAARFLQNACSLDPNSASHFNNFGTVLQKLGHTDEAILAYRKAVALDAGFSAAVTNLATALAARGEIAEALGLFASVSAALRNVPQFHFNVGQLHLLNHDFVQASASFAEAVKLKPDYSEALAGLARALKAQGDSEGSIAQLRRCLQHEPTSASALLELGHLLREQGQTAEARIYYQRAADADPQNWYAQWNVCLTLPILYLDPSEIGESRRNWRAGYERLWEWMNDRKGYSLPAVAPHTNFYLHYQGQNDLEEQRQFAALITRLSAQGEVPGIVRGPGKAFANRRKLRVGFASAFFNLHTVFKLFHGWIKELDRHRVEVFSIQLSREHDKATEYTRSISDRFLGCEANRDLAIRAILNSELDVLIYPELGMDPFTLSIAALRLAPVQCMGWGHPVTSGLATIDYFLSSELMEIPAADAHYSEKLIRLPNLSISFVEPDCATALLPKEIGPRGLKEVRYGCLQSLFKLLPQFDELYPQIALEVPGARFYFIGLESDGLNAKFTERLAKAFGKYGLAGDHFFRLLPRMSYGLFLGFVETMDVILDSVGWSGGTTTLEAIAFDKPIVTQPGDLMRSRHTAAILQRANTVGTIASSLDHYVRIAADLGRPNGLRAEVVAAIRAGKGRLYRDLAPIRALESFLVSAREAA